MEREEGRGTRRVGERGREGYKESGREREAPLVEGGYHPISDSYKLLLRTLLSLLTKGSTPYRLINSTREMHRCTSTPSLLHMLDS